MRRIHLGLALHNHQPVGNFPWVFEDVYRRAYKPMLEALERHPAIRVALHYSGPLLDWLRQAHPRFLPRVAGLVDRRQVEMMSGGYYEPILAVIPEEDRLGQIRKMTETVARDFGYQATGLWLAERVWEPSLPGTLNRAGVEWTVVDDTHFKMVGLDDDDLLGYYLTEDQGLTLKVFGTSKYMRYAVPWRPVSEVIAYLREMASEAENRIVVMGDDGEKFGSWPTTYEHCWKRGWVDEFFRAIEDNRDWLTTIPLGWYARANPPKGRVYLPTASYAEMGEWSLQPARTAELHGIIVEFESQGRTEAPRYLRGGFWRNFLAKYEESNYLHKKMLRVHKKVYEAAARGAVESGLDDLWKCQGNDPYWHGVFGGLYLADLRSTNYRNAIRAEKAADRALRGDRPWIEHEMSDFDLDGSPEVLLDSDSLSVYLKPAQGGAIFEWDLRRHDFNVASTLMRRPEAYHHILQQQENGAESPETEGKVTSIHEAPRAKEQGLAEALCYDWYVRNSFIDHFLDPETELENFSHCHYTERGDFVTQPYECSVKRQGDAIAVYLSREAMVTIRGRSYPMRVEKGLTMRAGSDDLGARIRITNVGRERMSAVFASEWNINLLGGGHNKFASYSAPGIHLDNWHLDSSGTLSGLRQLTLSNTGLGIELTMEADQAVDIWHFPLETVSNSEAGLERVYQASTVLLRLPVDLAPGDTQELGVRWTVR